MKHLMIVAIAMIAVVAFATPTFAQPASSSATMNVSVIVNPAMAVQTLGGSTLTLGTITSGSVTGTCRFMVDANTEQITLQVNASNLYKGDDPTQTVNVIPLVLSSGAYVNPTNATPLMVGCSETLPFTGSVGPSLPGGANGSYFPTFSTPAVPYESSQTGVFSQEVDVTVSWMNSNTQLPQGTYSGVVELVAVTYPGTT